MSDIPLIMLELNRPQVLDRRSGGRVNRNPTPAQQKGSSPGSKSQTDRDPSGSGTNAGFFKSSSDSGSTDIKVFGDLVRAKTIREHGFDSLDRQAQKIVLNNMSSAVKDPEVAKRVIAAVPVDVMNVFIGSERPTDNLLHNPAMLAHRLAVSSHEPIGTARVARVVEAVAAAFKPTFASGSTEESNLSGLDLGGDSIQNFATGGAVKPALRHKNSSRYQSINHNPTAAQKQAGNYKHEHISFAGFEISLENKRGSKRRGVGKDGKAWEVVMPADYGYFKRTEGSDGDHVDVYLGPHRASPKVFVIDQINAEDKSFDEHKVMMGFGSKAQALAIYQKAFSDGKGAQRIGGVKEMTIPQFKEWLKGDTTVPLKKGGIVPSVQPKKITRDAFLYLEPEDNQTSFAQCSSCYLMTGRKCLIHGPDIAITPDMTCAFYIDSKPQTNLVGHELRLVTPEQSGLVRGQVRCENCKYTSGNTGDEGCGLYRMLNQRQPEDFDLDPKIKSQGCCNAFVAAK